MKIILNSTHKGNQRIYKEKTLAAVGTKLIFRTDGRGKGWRGWGRAGKRGFDFKERDDDRAVMTVVASQTALALPFPN